MQRVMGTVLALVAAAAWAQDAPSYAPGENPFQGEFGYVAGQAVSLHVEIEGVRLDTLLLAPRGEVQADAASTCDFAISGSNVGEKKATLTTVLLLEDSNGRNLERLTLEPFKAKSGKPFENKQSVNAQGTALAAAAKMYVFVKIDF